jgi:ACS family hexuronate transporter-like MFS transporter
MMFFGVIIGMILQMTHGNYLPVFLIAGTAYLVAIGTIQLLAPRLAPVKIGEENTVAAGAPAV